MLKTCVPFMCMCHRVEHVHVIQHWALVRGGGLFKTCVPFFLRLGRAVRLMSCESIWSPALACAHLRRIASVPRSLSISRVRSVAARLLRCHTGVAALATHTWCCVQTHPVILVIHAHCYTRSCMVRAGGSGADIQPLDGYMRQR